MRKFYLGLIAAIAALGLFPMLASAKPNHAAGVGYSGNMTMSGRVSGSYKPAARAKSKYTRKKKAYRSKTSSRKAYRGSGKRASKKSYRRKSSKRRYSKKSSKKRYASRGKASASTGCLTSAARNLLGRIRSKFGNVQVISTCRPGARIAGSGKLSKHASGNAIDFRVPGRKAAVVSWLRANHRNGGIMTYSDMDHIHVDIGPRFVALGRRSGRT